MATPPPKKGIIWVHTRLVPSFAKKAIVHIAAGQFCVTLKLNQKIKKMNKEEKNHLINSECVWINPTDKDSVKTKNSGNKR